MKRVSICLLLMLLICTFGVACAEQEPKYLAQEETKYVRWSIEKYGESKSEVSNENDHCTLAIDVLPWTDWMLEAHLVTVPEEGAPTTEEVTAQCIWTSENSSMLHNELNHVSVYANTGAYTLRAKYTDSDGNTYSASFVFGIENISVPDTDEMRCAALLMLAEEGETLSVNMGSTISSFVQAMATTQSGWNTERLNKSSVYENSATFNHVIYESLKLGTLSKRTTFRVGSNVMEAVCVKIAGKDYVSFRSINGGTAKHEEAFDRVLNVFNSLGCTPENTVVTGFGFQGDIALFLSYTTGCRAVAFRPTMHSTAMMYAASKYPYHVAKSYTGEAIKVFQAVQLRNAMKYYPGDERVLTAFNQASEWGRFIFFGLSFGSEFADEIAMDDAAVNHRIYLGNGNDVLESSFGGAGAATHLFDAVETVENLKTVKELATEFAQWKKILKSNLAGFIFSAAESASDSRPNIIAGGKGRDRLQGTQKNDHYIYKYGDGYDFITDVKGNDAIYLLNCENAEVTCHSDVAGYWSVKINGEVAIEAYIGFGSGDMMVYKGTPDKITATVGRFSRTYGAGSTKEFYPVACPVNVHILDSDGVVVKTLYDGVPEEGSGAYGAYLVKQLDNGEYGKFVLLTDDSYDISMSGTDEGTMDYAAYRYDGETNEFMSCSVNNVPVQAGSLFYPTGSYASENILDVDWNGDGSIDDTLSNVTEISLPGENVQMSLGETVQLKATVGSGNCSLVWASLDPNVVTVDESGLLTAVGVGETSVGVIVDNGGDACARCTVTVVEGEYTVADFEVSGLSQWYEYTGKPIEPEISIRYKALALTEGVDYFLTYNDQLMPGKASLVIEGMGMYSGSLTLTYDIVEETGISVEEKVARIVAECNAQGFTDEYSKALWLHDWLVYNANYDYTYTYYFADGVLLKKTGVCNSYTLAYGLLLDGVGIENDIIVSSDMSHTWNIAKLDGEWCHIDCTWDDPGTGGAEYYFYFGMNDMLMQRDHQWEHDQYQSCTSLQNYYYLRMGAACFETEEEIRAYLSQMVSAKAETVFVCYTGSDPDFRMRDVFEAWFAANNAQYGIAGFSTMIDDYTLEVTPDYTEPWLDSETSEIFEILDPAVAGPEFALKGPAGVYRSSDYTSNGLVLVFGREGCLNTNGLMDSLHSEIERLRNGGVDVIVSIQGAESLDDLASIMADYPDFRYAYDATMDGTMWNFAEAVGIENAYITYPLVFIMNSDGKIVSYSSGYVYNIDAFVGEAFKTATGHVLPQPSQELEEDSLGAMVPEEAKGEALKTLFDISGQANGTLFVYDRSPEYSYTIDLLDNWQARSALFGALDLEMVACYDEITDEAFAQLSSDYPAVTFIKNDGYVMWTMLEAVGYPMYQPAYYLASYLIDSDGSIIDYTNGDLISTHEAATRFAFSMDLPFTVPAAVNVIDEESFMGTNVEAVDLSKSGVRKILGGAFKDCEDLTIVRMPSGISLIADNAFDGCDNVIFLCDYESVAYNYAVEHGIQCLTRY